MEFDLNMLIHTIYGLRDVPGILHRCIRREFDFDHVDKMYHVFPSCFLFPPIARPHENRSNRDTVVLESVREAKQKLIRHTESPTPSRGCTFWYTLLDTI